MKVMFIGDSHIATIKIAHHKYKPEFALKSGAARLDFLMLGPATDLQTDFFVRREDRIEFTNPNVQKRVSDWSAGAPCYRPAQGETVLVSAGFHTSTFLTGRTWLQHSPWWGSVAPGRSAMSDAVFRQMTLVHVRQIIEFYEAMLSLGTRVIALSAPPPTSRFWLRSQGYSNAEVLAMDRRFREHVAEHLAQLGIPVISPPAETMSDGWLRDEYLVEDLKDLHHGNAEYSRIYLHKILDALPALGR